MKPSDQKVILLFDGDILVYRAGFAAEKKMYQVGPDGPTVSSSKEARNLADKHGIPRSDIVSERVLQPLENAFNNLNNIVSGTTREISNRLGVNDPKNIRSIVFLTGCGSNPNFREEVAHTYKANRKPESKPTYYNEIRQYIQDHFNTVITEGAETDDYLCPASKDVSERYKDTVPIIVSIDKDLLSVPGNHYNFVKRELITIDEATADHNFFKQMLTGDRADNIQGLSGFGPVKAAKYTDPFVGNTPKMAATCVLQYKVHAGADWLQRWNENCHMLWIWRDIPDMCPFTFQSDDDALAFISTKARFY